MCILFPAPWGAFQNGLPVSLSQITIILQYKRKINTESVSAIIVFIYKNCEKTITHLPTAPLHGELTVTTCELNRNGFTRLLYSPYPAASCIKKIKAIAQHSAMVFIISSIFDFMHLHWNFLWYSLPLLSSARFLPNIPGLP